MAEQKTENTMDIIRDRKKRLAEKDETVVVWGRTSDARIAYALLNGIDLALKRLRDGMGYKYGVEEAASAIKTYNELLKDMAEFAENVCKLTNVEIRMPKSFKKAVGMEVDEEDTAPESKSE